MYMSRVPHVMYGLVCVVIFAIALLRSCMVIAKIRCWKSKTWWQNLDVAVKFAIDLLLTCSRVAEGKTHFSSGTQAGSYPSTILNKMNVLLVALAFPICIWSRACAHGIPLLKASLDVPKPVATLYYLKKLNVRVVALACPICIWSRACAHGILLLKASLDIPKPVATPLLSKKVNVLLVALAS